MGDRKTSYVKGHRKNFASVSDENQAWKKLISSTYDGDENLRCKAAYAIVETCSSIPDKEKVWKTLISLTKNRYGFVRFIITDALTIIYPHVSDKNQAYLDLNSLTQHRDLYVRRRAIYVLGSLFSQIPDKNKAYTDLIGFTHSGDVKVRMYANYFLGQASIFKATETESNEEFEAELLRALEFFTKASNETTFLNPASFCLPFYQSFYTVTFQKRNAETEVKKYLNRAKIAVSGSENKEKLIEAIENLAYAVKETKEDRNFDEIKYDLNSYRRYCERATELIDATEGDVPRASKLIRKALPIIDQKIKELILEIQDKAKAICEKAKDTPLEPLGRETNLSAKNLSVISDLSVEFEFDRMTATVLKFCDFLPSDKKPELCGKINAAKNMDAINKGEFIQETFDYILENFEFPRIKNISIAPKREKNTIKIATIQLHFELLTTSFPPKLKDKESMRLKILNALKKAREYEVDVVCFPELCIDEEWLPEIKNQCQDMIIIPGSYYDAKNNNTSQLIFNTSEEIPPQLKITPSAFEDSEIMGIRMRAGEKLINIYETPFGKFAVLICRDLGNYIHYLRGKVDVIFVPSYNSMNVRFHKVADNHVTNSPSYVIISNTALYGGTSIFGQLNKAYFNTLEQGGCKEKGDNSYKLCEIEMDREGMIVADFDLINKAPQLQTAIDPDEEKKPVKGIEKIDL